MDSTIIISLEFMHEKKEFDTMDNEKTYRTNMPCGVRLMSFGIGGYSPSPARFRQGV